jgi:hypothetical protein
MRLVKAPASTSLTDDRMARWPLVSKGHRAYRVRDQDAPRLWVEVTSRNKLFLVRKEVGGRSMDIRIGRFPAMTVAEA